MSRTKPTGLPKISGIFKMSILVQYLLFNHLLFVPRHSLLQSLILDDHFEPLPSPVAFVIWFSIDGQKQKTSSKEKTRQIDFRQKFGCLREVRVFFFQNLMARHCFGQKFPKQKKTAKFPKIPCNLKSKKILLSECGFGYF